ncbi:MAG: type IV pilin [Thermoplasmatales archaeon]|jgi:FlaG/FlaF family flagellin (archaellin)|nr:type IV pilin [Thermoplasmatales archaeon]
MALTPNFEEGEETVSAVIDVILMVAITVAIAATVYVYISELLAYNKLYQQLK